MEAQLRSVLPSDCGITDDTSNHYLGGLAKVRGGTFPSRFEFPWLVSLRFSEEVQCVCV